VAVSSIERADAAGSVFTVQTPGHCHRAEMSLGGVYNIYNALAAVTVARGVGVPIGTALRSLEAAKPAFGRVEEVDWDGRLLQLILVKNPAGLTQVLDTFLRSRTGTNILIAVNDLEADGRDVSWLWDVPFECLAGRRHNIIAAGSRAGDVAVRLHYAGIESTIIESIPEALDELHRRTGPWCARISTDHLHSDAFRPSAPRSSCGDVDDRISEPMSTLTIAHLYPQEMNTYGDSGNIIALQKRLQWRGYQVEVVDVHPGQAFDFHRADIVFGGGGQDSGQLRIADDLAKRGDELKSAAADGLPMLMVCGLYQLFGAGFLTDTGRYINGIGVFRATTCGSATRLVGNITVQSPFGTLVGFENHSGQTTLLPDQKPLGQVLKGWGNNQD